jgi:hypothetical protein
MVPSRRHDREIRKGFHSSSSRVEGFTIEIFRINANFRGEMPARLWWTRIFPNPEPSLVLLFRKLGNHDIRKYWCEQRCSQIDQIWKIPYTQIHFQSVMPHSYDDRCRIVDKSYSNFLHRNHSGWEKHSSKDSNPFYGREYFEKIKESCCPFAFWPSGQIERFWDQCQIATIVHQIAGRYDITSPKIWHSKDLAVTQNRNVNRTWIK